MKHVEFEQRVRSAAYRASAAVAVLPAVDTATPPRPADYVASYFTYMKQPIPAMTDGIREGFLHSRSQVQMLFVAINHTQWCLIADWLNTEFVAQITASENIRCFTDRVAVMHNEPFRQRIKGTDYLVLVSTPYGTKAAVHSHVKDIWRVDVGVLSNPPAPIREPEPMTFTVQLPDRLRYLPPRPTTFTPKQRKENS